MSTPLVSVITPVWNLIREGRRESFIRCAESVHGQSCRKIEHIVIDGCSNDGTLELLGTYAQKGWIRYISEEDSGIYQAMNKGLGLANGDYIAFMNSDDCYINREAIERGIGKMRMENADFSYSKTVYRDWSGNYHRELAQCEPEIGDIMFYMPFSHQSMVTKRGLFEGNYFNEAHRSISDYEWLLKAVTKGARGAYLEEATVEFLLGGMSDRLENQRMIQDELKEVYRELFSCLGLKLSGYDCEDIIYEKKLPAKAQGLLSNCLNIPFKARLGDMGEQCLEEKIRHYRQYSDRMGLNAKLLGKYLYFMQNGGKVRDFFEKRGYRDCAIYGLGMVGERLLYDLEGCHFPVKYVIDQNADNIRSNIPVKKLDGQLEKVDVVVITPLYYAREIRQALADNKVEADIITIEEILKV